MTQASLFPEPREIAIQRLDHEILRLLLGNPGGPLGLVLSRDEKEVLLRLRYVRGLANPMQIRELSVITGLSPREIKDIVRTLRLNFHLPIGSSKRSNGGYYLMVSKEDIAAWAKEFTDQIRAQAEVLRAVIGASALQEILGQLALEAAHE